MTLETTKDQPKVNPPATDRDSLPVTDQALVLHLRPAYVSAERSLIRYVVRSKVLRHKLSAAMAKTSNDRRSGLVSFIRHHRHVALPLPLTNLEEALVTNKQELSTKEARRVGRMMS
jgi:hypothetical protein